MHKKSSRKSRSHSHEDDKSQRKRRHSEESRSSSVDSDKSPARKKKNKDDKPQQKHVPSKDTSTSDESSSESSSSSSLSSSDSSSSSSKLRKKKMKKKAKKKLKKQKRKLKKQLKKQKKKIKKATRAIEKRKTDKSLKTDTEAPMNEVVDEMLAEKSKAMTPMTKEEWEKRQSVVRRVFDEETGRHRLIKGDGEVIEEIVSRERHREINKQATRGDGDFFQSKLAGGLPK
ncbi:hypothetical protein R5R35_009861 [Gryllus longicercus]|uniref:ADP-ribosylation factor-like protein 6-interacting protein 4 n=1 Tax=Gryllus longicercus TaxID=2509291 RepID=A0AAN9VZK1_9ORTH